MLRFEGNILLLDNFRQGWIAEIVQRAALWDSLPPPAEHLT